jgi:hypothetical protein
MKHLMTHRPNRWEETKYTGFPEPFQGLKRRRLFMSLNRRKTGVILQVSDAGDDAILACRALLSRSYFSVPAAEMTPFRAPHSQMRQGDP